MLDFIAQVPLRVRNVTRGKLLADRAEEAKSFARRFMGLMGQRNLNMGAGLHIVPCNGIHTFFMRIAIDALFLDGSYRVVKVFNALPPWRMTSIFSGAASVLELPAGVVLGSGTEEGDQLEFTTEP